MKKNTYGTECFNETQDIHEILNVKLTWYEKLLFPIQVVFVRLEDKLLQRKYRRQRAEKGYAQCDVYEVSDWFVKTVKSILADLHDRTCCHPQELEFDEWRGILSEMVRLHELMDSYDDLPIRKELGIDENDMSTESNKKIVSAMNEAKNEFFTLFNKWFYHLWF